MMRVPHISPMGANQFCLSKNWLVSVIYGVLIRPNFAFNLVFVMFDVAATHNNR